MAMTKREHELRKAAMTHAENGEWELAIQYIEQISTLNPKDPTDAAWLANCMSEVGRDDEAIIHLETIDESLSEVSKGRILLWNQLGICLKNQGHYVKAGAYFLKASDEEPNKNSLTLLAMCQLHFHPEGALLHANKALEIDADWEEAINVRTQALAMLGDV